MVIKQQHINTQFFFYIYVCVLVFQWCPTLCNSMDCSLSGSSVQNTGVGKNTGVGRYSLLQSIFPTQGSNPRLLCLLNWQEGSSPSESPGKPKLTICISYSWSVLFFNIFEWIMSFQFYLYSKSIIYWATGVLTDHPRRARPPPAPGRAGCGPGEGRVLTVRLENWQQCLDTGCNLCQSMLEGIGWA